MNALPAATVDDLLNRCADRFALVSGGSDAFLNAAVGLRYVLLATDHPEPAQASADAITRAADAIRVAAPVVANNARSLAEDRVHFGMGAACGLVRLFGQHAEEFLRGYSRSLVLDRIDHTAILADELDVLHRRRAIAARGDTLCRHIALRRALEASADGATLH